MEPLVGYIYVCGNCKHIPAKHRKAIPINPPNPSPFRSACQVYKCKCPDYLDGHKIPIYDEKLWSAYWYSLGLNGSEQYF